MKRINGAEFSDELCSEKCIDVTIYHEHDHWDKEDAIEVINHLLEVFDIDRFNDLMKG